MTVSKTVGIALDADYLVFSCLQAAEVEEDWGKTYGHSRVTMGLLKSPCVTVTHPEDH